MEGRAREVYGNLKKNDDDDVEVGANCVIVGVVKTSPRFKER